MAKEEGIEKYIVCILKIEEQEMKVTEVYSKHGNALCSIIYNGKNLNLKPYQNAVTYFYYKNKYEKDNYILSNSH